MCRNVLRTATGRRQLSLCNSSRSHHRLDRRCHDEAGVCRLFPLQRNRWRMCRNVPRTATGRRQLLPRRGGRDMLHSSVRTRFINRQRKRWMFQMDLRWVPWLLLSVLLTVEGQQQGGYCRLEGRYWASMKDELSRHAPENLLALDLHGLEILTWSTGLAARQSACTLLEVTSVCLGLICSTQKCLSVHLHVRYSLSIHCSLISHR